MQVSIDLKPEVYKYFEFSALSLGKSISELISAKLQADYEELQKANKALADFLKPSIIAARKGEVSDKTFKELVKEGLEKAKGSQI